MSTTEFDYTGARAGWTVPLGVTSVKVDATGACGGGNMPEDSMNADPDNPAGVFRQGGRVVATIQVTPGQICYLRVGGPGDFQNKGNNQALGGYPGGGNGTSSTDDYFGGCGGGGYSDLRLNADTAAAQQVVAGGGGGLTPDRHTAETYPHWTGGNGTTAAGGAGGTYSASDGGLAQPTAVQYNGNAGARGQGGNAPDPTPIPAHAPVSGTTYRPNPPISGGGGGGYYGGGSGAWAGDSYDSYAAGHGGNGSNFVVAGATGVTNTAPKQVTTPQPALIPAKIILTYSLPPNAPATSAPFNGSNQDDTQPIVFTWTDPPPPETGDAITGAQIQFRPVGTSTWTQLATIANNGGTYSAATGTFPAGTQIEWQVRSKGTLTANYGPWSASSFFTPIAPPVAPTIDTPTAAQTISNSPQTVSWESVPGQQAYEVRRTDGGATIYYDSGVIQSPITSATVPFSTASRTEHVQVRVMVNGLWSVYADVSVTVAIVPPSAPSIAAVADNTHASIVVTVTNPTGGGGGGVAVDHNDIFRSDPQTDEIRVATGVPTNGSWTDVTPASNVAYSYRAEAVAASGAVASS